jgi:hypothetical protein
VGLWNLKVIYFVSAVILNMNINYCVVVDVTESRWNAAGFV